MVATSLNFNSNLHTSSQVSLTQIPPPLHDISLPTTITVSYNINPHYVQIFLVFWTGLMIVGMLYGSREKIVEWWGEERRKKEFEVWREEEREKWRGVVAVGILNGGVRGGKGGKRVRFLDGMEGESKDQAGVEYKEELGS
jgi:hypothetical protein